MIILDSGLLFWVTLYNQSKNCQIAWLLVRAFQTPK